MSVSDPYWKLRTPPATPEDEICRCRVEAPILLGSHLSPNPLRCVRCNLEIEPSTVPVPLSLVDAIAHWTSIAHALEILELDSGPYEEWAYSQLLDPVSQFVIEGRDLAQELGKVRVTYLSMPSRYVEVVDSYNPLAVDRCPICEQALRPLEDSLTSARVCDTHLLSFDDYQNERPAKG